MAKETTPGNALGSDDPLYPSMVAQKPSQGNDPPELSELHNSREVREDYQREIIAHVFDVPGEPSEAILDSRLGGFNAGDIHPWAAAGGDEMYNFHFLVDRSMKHLAKDSNREYRKSEMTAVYRQQPCPYMYEQELRVATRSVPEWWAKERVPNDPRGSRLTGTRTPISVPQPRPVLVRRYRKVQYTLTDLLLGVVRHVGRVSDRWWLGMSPGTWLFEGVHARMLYGRKYAVGSYEYSMAWWDVTLFFEADVERKHELWRPRGVRSGTLMGDGTPIPWQQGVAREDLHHRYKIFSDAPVNFSEIIDIPDRDKCIPPEPPP